MRKDDKIKSTEQRTPPPPDLAFTSKKPQAGAEGATAGPPLTIHSTCKNQFPYSDSRPSSSTHPLNPLWKGACPTISLEFWKERPPTTKEFEGKRAGCDTASICCRIFKTCRRFFLSPFGISARRPGYGSRRPWDQIATLLLHLIKCQTS